MLGLHAVHQLLPRHTFRETIGIRQQRTLRRDLHDLSGQVRIGPQALDDLLAGQAFRHRNLLQDGAALDERVENLAHARFFLDFVFAGLDHRFLTGNAAVKPRRIVLRDEDPPVGNDSVLLQAAGDLYYALALRDHRNGWGSERPGRIEAGAERKRQSAAEQQQQEDEGQRRIKKAEEAIEATRLAARLQVPCRARWPGRGDQVGRTTRRQRRRAHSRSFIWITLPHRVLQRIDPIPRSYAHYGCLPSPARGRVGYAKIWPNHGA